MAGEGPGRGMPVPTPTKTPAKARVTAGCLLVASIANSTLFPLAYWLVGSLWTRQDIESAAPTVLIFYGGFWLSIFLLAANLVALGLFTLLKLPHRRRLAWALLAASAPLLFVLSLELTAFLNANVI